MTNEDPLVQLARAGTTASQPTETLREYIQRNHDRADANVRELRERMELVRKGRDKGYTNVLADLGQRRAASQGYRTALKHLLDALDRGLIDG